MRTERKLGVLTRSASVLESVGGCRQKIQVVSWEVVSQELELSGGLPRRKKLKRQT